MTGKYKHPSLRIVQDFIIVLYNGSKLFTEAKSAVYDCLTQLGILSYITYLLIFLLQHFYVQTGNLGEFHVKS